MFAIDQQGCGKLLRIAFEVKKRPLLFFNEKSFTNLMLLLQGFVYGYNNCGHSKEKICDWVDFHKGTGSENIWAEFQEYFHKKYNTSSIYHVEVLEQCGSEEKAFDLFFEELEWYLTEHGLKIPEVR